jgi:LysR family hydrogen peroxide-inducible transcriptional activator
VVAERGSFRRAAEACHASQPSLSVQVGVAERTLGVLLFERTARRVRVPPSAALLSPFQPRGG